MGNRRSRWLWVSAFLLVFLSVVWTKGTIAHTPHMSQVIQAQVPNPKFADTQNHWARSCIESLAQRNVMKGFPDGTFRPDNAVTRSQFAAMVVGAFPTEPGRSSSNFSDVPSNYWAAAAIQKAVRSGFLSGYPDGTFQPEANINRSEAFTAFASGLKYPQASLDLRKMYRDSDRIPAYAPRSIAASTQKGVVVNFPEANQLQPLKAATRGELAASICRATPDLASSISGRYIPTPIAQREIRGVWMTNIDSDVLWDSSKSTAAINELARLNFNTIYPVVWNWGYTLYPSQVMKRDIGFAVDPRPEAAGLRSRDMLQQLVTEGHQKGLAVIPWFEFGFFAPKESELAQKHKDWWTQKQDGSVDGDPRGLDGKQIPIWFNPFRPEVQQMMLDLVMEVVTQYDVDGIQFDDHFGLPVEFGYDDYTVKLYQHEHAGKSPPRYDAARCQKANQAALCPEFMQQDPQWAEWMAWRSSKLQAFLDRMFKTVKAKKPNVIIGLSPLDLPYAYDRMLVRWDKWEQAGLIEEIIPQIYFQGQKFVDRIELSTHPELKAAQSHIPTAIGILSGLASTPRSIDELQRQIQAVRDRNYAGVSFFFYETLWNKSPEPLDARKAGWQTAFPSKVERSKL